MLQPAQTINNSFQIAQDYARVERAIAYIETHRQRQPDLEEIAAHIGLSPFHFQRLFTNWAGVSPKQFLKLATLEHAKQLLQDSATVLDTAYETGLSSASRLHDLFVTCEAVTPGGYKMKGKDVTIRHGIHPTPFGDALIGLTDKGVCELDFVRDASQALDTLAFKWPNATWIKDESATRRISEIIFSPSANKIPLHLHIRGTPFQLKVWQALLRIPSGALVSYGDIAAAIGNQAAIRAVGTAVGDNPIAWLIPCHRVLRKSGAIGGYATGTPRKRAMLALEALQTAC